MIYTLIMEPNKKVLEQFGLNEKATFLPGGERRTYRVGDVVLKHINNDNSEHTKWIAETYSQIKEDGFRIPRPLKSVAGEWITDEGWSAWTFLDGNHDYRDNVPESIQAIIKFHDALKGVARPSFLSEIDSAYKRADQMTWGDKPEQIHPELKEMVQELYNKKVEMDGLGNQLIHGDLNPNNILFQDSLSPAIIDIAPYWRPVEFSLGVYAYWIGPWRDDEVILEHFKNIKHFDQMLVRAGIRMLLIMSEFNKINDFEKYKTATEIVLKRF